MDKIKSFSGARLFVTFWAMPKSKAEKMDLITLKNYKKTQYSIVNQNKVRFLEGFGTPPFKAALYVSKHLCRAKAWSTIIELA